MVRYGEVGKRPFSLSRSSCIYPHDRGGSSVVHADVADLSVHLLLNFREPRFSPKL